MGYIVTGVPSLRTPRRGFRVGAFWRADAGGGILEEGFSIMLVLGGILFVWEGREYSASVAGEWFRCIYI